MLTAVQRAEILRLTAESDLDLSTATSEDIWYDLLSALFGAGKTLKDLKLSRSQQAEIVACLRRAPPVAPRTFGKRTGSAEWCYPTSVQRPD
jgi:hypothetical protein